MNKFLTLFLFFGLPFFSSGQSQNTDSLIHALIRDIQVLKSDNENLQKRLESQNSVLNDITMIQNLSDQAKWDKIKSNIKTGRKGYDLLNKKILALKSELISQDYQNYIKSLGSIKESPLGFSFDEVILKTAQDKLIFQKKNFSDRFVKTVKSISVSPLVGLIPFASEAVTISSSVLSIAYSAGFQDEKIDFDKIKDFEKELNRYISFYIELDKANVMNNSSNYQTIILIESIQFDLLTEIKKTGAKMNYIAREQKPDETIDDYLIALLNDLSDDYIDNYIRSIEVKNNRKVDSILQAESNIKNINNNLDNLIQLTNRFKNINDSYFDLSGRYFAQLKMTIELANKNKIIQAIKDKTAVQVYEELIYNLTVKRQKSESTLRSNVNLNELLNNNNKLDLVKFI